MREAVFSRLMALSAPPERVLDLYAGSGALGLEALSRGAQSAVFVESDRRAAELIERNADALGLGARASVVCARVNDWLRTERAPFGWIFADPPYDDAPRELPAMLRQIVKGKLLANDGWLSVEQRAPAKSDPARRFFDGDGLVLDDTRQYGQTAVSFFTSFIAL